MLTERLGRVVVRSSGFGPEGIPAIDDAVAAMNRRGLDVSQHRSRSTTVALLDGPDVIITAERAHVVKIAALSPSAFARAMTLPELLARAADAPLAPDTGGVRAWVESLTAERTAGTYLRAPVPEVADPTGSIPRAFEAAVVTIERQCGEASALLARIASGR
jgi:protein-tyrosine-phosphatase